MTTTAPIACANPTAEALHLIPVIFYCGECQQGYRTKLPPIIADIALTAWARVHLTDTGCHLKGAPS